MNTHLQKSVSSKTMVNIHGRAVTSKPLITPLHKKNMVRWIVVHNIPSTAYRGLNPLIVLIMGLYEHVSMLSHPTMQIVFSDKRPHFQDYSTPIHTCWIGQDWFYEHNDTSSNPFSALIKNALNLIQPLWGILHSRFFPPRTLPKSETILRFGWERIVLNNLRHFIWQFYVGYKLQLMQSEDVRP